MVWAHENGAIIDALWQLSPLAFITTVTSVLCVEVRVGLDAGEREMSLSRRQRVASLPGVRNKEKLRHISSQGLLWVTSYKIEPGFPWLLYYTHTFDEMCL